MSLTDCCSPSENDLRRFIDAVSVVSIYTFEALFTVITIVSSLAAFDITRDILVEIARVCVFPARLPTLTLQLVIRVFPTRVLDVISCSPQRRIRRIRSAPSTPHQTREEAVDKRLEVRERGTDDTNIALDGRPDGTTDIIIYSEIRMNTREFWKDAYKKDRSSFALPLSSKVESCRLRQRNRR